MCHALECMRIYGLHDNMAQAKKILCFTFSFRLNIRGCMTFTCIFSKHWWCLLKVELKQFSNRLHLCDNDLNKTFEKSHGLYKFHFSICFRAEQRWKPCLSQCRIESFTYRYCKCVLYLILKITIVSKTKNVLK